MDYDLKRVEKFLDDKTSISLLKEKFNNLFELYLDFLNLREEYNNYHLIREAIKNYYDINIPEVFSDINPYFSKKFLDKLKIIIYIEDIIVFLDKSLVKSLKDESEFFELILEDFLIDSDNIEVSDNKNDDNDDEKLSLKIIMITDDIKEFIKDNLS